MIKWLVKKVIRMNPGGVLTVTNLTLTNANEKYEFVLPSWTRAICIQARPQIDVKVYSDVNSSSYFTIKADGAYFESDIIYSGKLFFESSMAGTVLEIITWNIKI